MISSTYQGKPFAPEMVDLRRALHYLEDEEIAIIAPYLTGVSHEPDTVVMHEGEQGDWMAFVVNGKLAVKKKTNFPGKHVLVALLEEGSMIGEISVMERGRRAATVTVVEPCRLLYLSSANVDNLLQKHPKLGIKILRRILHVVGIRVKKADDRLAKLL
jgi:CRP/FNR family cyclic AMP-dependent transcriptional regulator